MHIYAPVPHGPCTALVVAPAGSWAVSFDTGDSISSAPIHPALKIANVLWAYEPPAIVM